MARPLRIEYPGAWYHVMNRGRRREEIFIDRNDYQTYLDLVGKCYGHFELEVHAYSLMPNHYHLLVRTPRGNLSRAMRHLDGIYTQKFNRRYGHDGALFKGRYKAILADQDNYVMELVRYIHRNPLKAGLERSLGKHEWTSHRYYLDQQGRPPWLQCQFVLQYFSHREKEALKQLDAFVAKESPPDLAQRLSGGNWPAILGSDKFKEWVREKFLGKRLDEKAVPQIREVLRQRKIGDLKKTAEKLWAVDSDFWFKVRRGRENPIRRAMIYASRKHLKATNREISEEFGGIGHAAISMQCRFAEEEIQRREGCWKAVGELEEAINLQLKP